MSFYITWKCFASRINILSHFFPFTISVLSNDTSGSYYIPFPGHDFCFCLISLITQFSLDINDQSFQILLILQSLTHILQLRGMLPLVFHLSLAPMLLHGTILSLIICYFVLWLFPKLSQFYTGLQSCWSCHDKPTVDPTSLMWWRFFHFLGSIDVKRQESLTPWLISQAITSTEFLQNIQLDFAFLAFASQVFSLRCLTLSSITKTVPAFPLV